MDVCKQRIHQHAAFPSSIDDHFVSDYVLHTFYPNNIDPNISYALEREFGIERQRVKHVDNTSSLTEFLEEVKNFGEDIIMPEKRPEYTELVYTF